MGNAKSVADQLEDDEKKQNETNTEHEFIFCKAKSTDLFSEQFKMKCKPMPHSLFSEQKSDSEKLLSKRNGIDIDRRKKAPIFDIEHEIHNIVYLTMKFDDEEKGYHASGTIIHRSLNSVYILTAAHNVIDINNDIDCITHAQQINFSILSNTSNGYKEIASYVAHEWYPHNGYLNKPTASGGHDIAIIKAVINDDTILRKMKPIKLRQFKSEFIEKNVKVIGFPGEADKRGQLYEMDGNYTLNKQSILITYDDIDTTGGQSGCPILYTDQDRECGVIIGVHTGGKPKQLNYGTALNDEKLEWIAAVLNYDSLAQPNYQCNALLISPDYMYDKYLDRMYKTFNNSKAINSKKLYFSNNDGDIDKKQILDEIYKTLIEAKHLNQKTILCFCGKSDKKGNWIINKQSTYDITISLKDIMDILKQSGHCKSLFIITDCSYSENWIIDANEFNDYYINKQGIFIQASARKNEEADPGRFLSKYSCSCLHWIRNISTAATIGRTLLTVPTATASVVIAAPVALLWDNGVKRIYHISKVSNPVSSHKYYHEDYKYCIAFTNDEEYKVSLALVNSWSKMDTMETGGAIFKYGYIGYAGNC